MVACVEQVLYRMFENLSVIGMDAMTAGDVVKGVASFVVVLAGSTLIGLVLGLLGSATTRFTHHARLTEPLLLYCVSYLAFVAAELFHLSGILAYVTRPPSRHQQLSAYNQSVFSLVRRLST